MVQRFPPETDDTVTITTKLASQRRVSRDEKTGLSRIGSVQIPVEFGRFAVHAFGMTDLKKHFGPAVVYERTDFNPNAQRHFDAPVHRQSSTCVYPVSTDLD